MSAKPTAHTARKAHGCDSCNRTIHVGDRYLRHVAFPSDDFYSWVDRDGRPLRRPVTAKECGRCAERYGRADELEDRHA